MVQSILKDDTKSLDYEKNALNIVESINNYIRDNDCPHLAMDISHLNVIDASKVTLLCSTFHWSKYPEGKISWKISSNDIKDLVNPLSLGNIRLINSQ